MVAPAEAASFKNGAPMAEIGARAPSRVPTVLAGGLVISALLDTLHSKGILTPEESRKVLDAALASVGPYAESREGFEATQVIGLLRVRFT